MEKHTVYIETSIVSYLTARPSRDLLASAWKKATVDWWEMRRTGFNLCTSDAVREEAARGHAEAAARRINALAGIPVLPNQEVAFTLAEALVKGGAFPANSFNDAFHVALCAAYGVDFLLTWNFRHLDNAELKPIIRTICISRGFACPEICNPQELMGGPRHAG